MSSERIIKIIDGYFDNEITREEEAFMFTELSANPEAREYFKKMNTLRNTLQSTVQPFPDSLEEKIFNNLREEKEPKIWWRNKNFFPMVSYAITIILIAVTVILYNQAGQFKNQLDSSVKQINQQNQLIGLLYNSMPGAEIRTTVDNEVIITEKL